MLRVRILSLGVVAAGIAFAAPLAAQGGYVGTDNLGYVPTITCYSNLVDATAHTNATCNTTGPQRDLSLFLVNNNTAFSGVGYPPSAAYLLTNWFAGYADPLNPQPGENNPNNSNVGFFQITDYDGGSMTSMSTTWNPTFTSYTLAASGGPTIPGCTAASTEDCGRLWDGVTSANGGSFFTWNINATFSGFSTSTFFDAGSNVYLNNSNPTSAIGTITGVFFDGTTQNYYDLQATINTTSWAVANGHGTMPSFGAPAGVTATPEPASIALMATGLAGLCVVARRRRQRPDANA